MYTKNWHLFYPFLGGGAGIVIKNKQFFEAIKQNGKLDFEKSRLLSNPKTHYLRFVNQKGITIGANTLWYKDRIDIIRLDLSEKVNCK